MAPATILVTGSELAEAAVERIRKAGYEAVFVPPYTGTEDLIECIKKYAPIGVISRMGRLDAQAIAASPGLKVISKHGVGVDNIDVEAASSRGIPVIVAYGANAQSVAEHTWALLLAVVKQIRVLDAGVRAGRWEKPSFIGRELAGGRLSLVGFGATARQMAACAQAFSLKVTAFDPFADDSSFEECGVSRAASLQEALTIADFVSLHCPLTDQTKNLINRQTLEAMKPGAYLVNTARGGLIDESALLHALQSGRLAGAGLDTFATEPPPADHPFWTEERLILTPHIAGVTEQASTRVAIEAAEGVVTVLSGSPIEPYRIVNRSSLERSAALNGGRPFVLGKEQ